MITRVPCRVIISFPGLEAQPSQVCKDSPEPALRLTLLGPYHHQLMLLEPVSLHTHTTGFLQGLHLCLLREIIWKMTSLPGT